MTAVVNTASAFVIQEDGGENRRVRLVERALPYRPFTLSGTQRVELTWYPGSPEATSTVLGAAEDATTVTGAWKDKFLGQTVQVAGGGTSATVRGNDTVPFTVDGRRVQTAKEAAAVIDSIRRQGQPVVVTWDEQARRGHLTKFEQNWQNTHDLEWSIEFTWTGFAETTPDPTVTQEFSVGDTASLVNRQFATLRTASVATFATPPDFNAALAGLLGALGDAVDQATGAAENLADLVLAPADAARRVVAIANAIVEQCAALLAFIDQNPPRTLVVTTTPLDQLALGQVVAALAYTRGVVAATRDLQRTAVIRRALLAESVADDLLAIHEGREDQNLRDVSEIYYNTPFEWQRILTFNNLASAVLARGQVVLIPRVPAGGRT